MFFFGGAPGENKINECVYIDIYIYISYIYVYIYISVYISLIFLEGEKGELGCLEKQFVGPEGGNFKYVRKHHDHDAECGYNHDSPGYPRRTNRQTQVSDNLSRMERMGSLLS